MGVGDGGAMKTPLSQSRGVDFVIIHGSLMGPDEFGEMTSRLLTRPAPGERVTEAIAKRRAKNGSRG